MARTSHPYHCFYHLGSSLYFMGFSFFFKPGNPHIKKFSDRGQQIMAKVQIWLAVHFVHQMAKMGFLLAWLFFTFLKGCKINQRRICDRNLLWLAKPKIFTLALYKKLC